MSVSVFGIRHHGPGCARALRQALDALAPDVVLVEGPPDAAEVLPLVGDAAMEPPVALLVYALDDPRRAAFYPFAAFSPEWHALRFASERGVPARFIDLPCAHTLAIEPRFEAVPAPADEEAASGEDEPAPAASAAEPDADEERLREDPVGVLAEAAGFTDREQWWDAQVEQRRDAAGLFEAILEAMVALRADRDSGRPLEAQREAHMRTAIRAAQKEGFERIAVVCGAWHAPALATLGPAKKDAELLKGLPKLKVASTWVPWTHSRLASRSGYGAGVDSPGWYAHVYERGENAPLAWAVRAARLLREQDLDASSASAIETVRLAGALAAMRDLATPGLCELRESIESVLCGGEPARLALIRDRLEIGEALGRVPEGAPQVPLARDLEREAKRLRLKLSAEDVALDFDLRKDTDRDRSRLLHRLTILGVAWGRPHRTTRGAGTFREGWQLCWRPELAIDVVAANVHGNTIDSAASQALRARAAAADLAELPALVEVAIVAFLPAALDVLLAALDEKAAGSSDVRLQMEALDPLARIARYGDVRETRADDVLPVLRALFERVFVGLRPACSQLDDEAAAQMTAAIGRAHAACLLLDEPPLRTGWLGALGELLEGAEVHPRVRGRACRLLLEQKALANGELERRASLALSAAVAPPEAAQWIEGLVAGEGLMLVHQEELLTVLDAWMAALAADVFQAQLPLLRRAFSSLSGPERRAVAQKVKRGARAEARRAAAESEPLDEGRVALVLPVLARILGVSDV